MIDGVRRPKSWLDFSMAPPNARFGPLAMRLLPQEYELTPDHHLIANRDRQLFTIVSGIEFQQERHGGFGPFLSRRIT